MARLRKKDLFPFYIDTKRLKIIDGKKYCSICDQYLELSNFEPNKAKYLGYNYWCIECMNKHKR